MDPQNGGEVYQPQSTSMTSASSLADSAANYGSQRPELLEPGR